MKSIDYTNDPRAVLIHFNPNHDKLGRFAKNNGTSSKKSIKGPPAALVGAVSAAGMALAADNLLKEYGSGKASKSTLQKIARVGGAAYAGAIAGAGLKKIANKNLDNVNEKQYNKNKDRKNLKKAIGVGAGLAAASLLVAGGIYLSKTGKLDKYIDTGKRLLNKNTISDVKISELYSGGVKAMKSNVGKSIDQIDTHMIASINKAGLSSKRERTINCSHCSVAYILNSMFGMSVKAKPFSGVDEKSGFVAVLNKKGELATPGRDKTIIKAIFDGVEEIEFSRKAKPEKLLDTIEKNPNRQQKLMRLGDAVSMIKSGTTGILAVATTDGGHLMNYEKDSNGLLTFVDSQANRIAASSDVLDLWNDVVVPISAFDCTNASIRAEAWEILKNMVE